MHDTDYLTISQAAKVVPGRPSASTIWRWIHRGICTASGERIYLAAWRFGSKHFTTRQALDAFAARLTEANREHYSAKPEKPTRPAEQSRAHHDAERELSAIGL